MIVALFAVVAVLDVLLTLGIILVVTRGFEQRSVVEWYVDLKRERRRRLYTTLRPRRA